MAEVMKWSELNKQIVKYARMKFFSVSVSGDSIENRYARVSIRWEVVGMDENEKDLYKVSFVPGIRFMGDLSVDDMHVAANAVSAAAVAADHWNLKLEDVLVSRS